MYLTKPTESRTKFRSLLLHFSTWCEGFIIPPAAYRDFYWSSTRSRCLLLIKKLPVGSLLSHPCGFTNSVVWNTYIVIFMKPSKRQARSRWVAAGIGWSRFRKLQPLLQLRTNEINSGSVRATVANEIYMKLRIRMASSRSGSFAKRWFLGRNKMKRMSAREGILFKEKNLTHFILNYWKFWNIGKGGGELNLQLKRWEVCNN